MPYNNLLRGYPDVARIYPVIVNEENAGFFQNKNGNLYSATVGSDDPLKNASYFILFNPLHSMRDIYIRRIVHTNVSSVPVLVKAYCNCCDLLPKSAVQSNRITNNNTRYCDVPPTAQLFTGSTIPCIHNTSMLEYAVQPYENFVNEVNGSIILSPGSYYFEASKCLTSDCVTGQISSISWLEQPIRKCGCNLAFETED